MNPSPPYLHQSLLRLAVLAKRAAQFPIDTRLLPQSPHVNLSSEEEDVSDVDTGETEAEDIW